MRLLAPFLIIVDTECYRFTSGVERTVHRNGQYVLYDVLYYLLPSNGALVSEIHWAVLGGHH